MRTSVDDVQEAAEQDEWGSTVGKDNGLVNKVQLSQATFGVADRKNSQTDKKDDRRKVTVDMSIQNTLYDKKSQGFNAGRKQSQKTYGSVTEQAAMSGGFQHEGVASSRTR